MLNMIDEIKRCLKEPSVGSDSEGHLNELELFVLLNRMNLAQADVCYDRA